MSFRVKLGLTYAFAMICALLPAQSISLNCPTESLEDMVIDIQSSLANGIRGIEPIHTETHEDCINSGCLTKNITGRKECNLIIFDTRKATKQPNCYLFYCPSEEACPLKPTKGVMTFRILKGFPPLNKADLPHPDATPKSYYLTGKSSQAVMDPVQLTAQLNQTNVLLKATVNTSDERSTQLPGIKSKDHLQSSELSLKQKEADVLSENVIVFQSKAEATSQSTVSTTPVPDALQSTIPPLIQQLIAPLKITTEPHPTVFTISQSISATTTTTTTTTPQPPTPTISTGFTATINQPTITTKTASTTMSNATTSVKVTLETGQFKETTIYPSTFPSSTVDFFAIKKIASQEIGRLGLSNSPLDNVPRNRFHLQFEKWTLIGTLFCGLLFLVIGLILLGRKLSESLQRKKYSRLDYLINGIYVDI
ncbi:MANSC domain-containing protein 1 [Gracilinanus agilis]|uniref:MANSC domain-containing protein 1 n=1 Tax=Gracilinanus agilis TaxID=191870 RepID=UPI001CFE596C|nr:MANSC domain-containing protein 1 [Gracilinanus agilis]